MKALNPKNERQRRWWARNKEKRRVIQRRHDLRRNFGISIEQYDAMLALQGGVCAICKEQCPSGRRLAVDHEHETKRVRGLLCGRCNPMIGYAQDDPRRLVAGADYLLRTKEVR